MILVRHQHVEYIDRSAVLNNWI